MPIQRIPRYRLLLQELVKRTPPGHPDRLLCNKALQTVAAVAACRVVDILPTRKTLQWRTCY